MTIIELRAKRANLWEQAQALHAAANGRALSAEEQPQWDGLMAEIDSLKAQIDREERLIALNGELNASTGTRVANRPADGQGADRAAYRAAFWGWMRNGTADMEPEQRQLLRNRAVAVPAEARALGVASGAAGGYAVADEDMGALVDAMKFFGGMRQSRATILPTDTGADLPIPTTDDTGNTGSIVSENTQLAEQDVTFAQKVLHAYLYTSKIVRVSYQLLQDTSFPLETWLMRKLGERIGRATNAHFTTGTGSGQPEGVVTGATTAGTTAAAGAVTYAELLTLFHSVDVAYRNAAQWMMNDSTVKLLKALEDTEGHLIWSPGLATREPDTIMGKPYIVNNDVAAIAANAKGVLFGDFANYYIRDTRDVTILRLTERYADYLQVGFIAFSRHDGALIDAGQHPIKFLTQHA